MFSVVFLRVVTAAFTVSLVRAATAPSARKKREETRVSRESRVEKTVFHAPDSGLYEKK